MPFKKPNFQPSPTVSRCSPVAVFYSELQLEPNSKFVFCTPFIFQSEQSWFGCDNSLILTLPFETSAMLGKFPVFGNLLE